MIYSPKPILDLITIRKNTDSFFSRSLVIAQENTPFIQYILQGEGRMANEDKREKERRGRPKTGQRMTPRIYRETNSSK